MSRLTWVVPTLMLLPAVALAADAPVVLDLTTGAPRELLDKTLGLARGLFVFFFVLSLVAEGFGKSPVASKDYAGCVSRAAIVFVLLLGYGRIFGSVINLTESIAARVTPAQVWTSFWDSHKAGLEKLFAQKSKADEDAAKTTKGEAKASLWQKADDSLSGSLVGGVVFDSAVSLLVLTSQAVVWVMAFLARVLGALFYVIGPLALVAGIPRISNTGGRWFRTFVTLLSWPIFSGLLLSLTLALSQQGMALQGVGPALGSVVSALLMVATALLTPLLASNLIGGSANVAEQSFRLAYSKTGAAAGAVYGSARSWAARRGSPAGQENR